MGEKVTYSPFQNAANMSLKGTLGAPSFIAFSPVENAGMPAVIERQTLMTDTFSGDLKAASSTLAVGYRNVRRSF